MREKNVKQNKMQQLPARLGEFLKAAALLIGNVTGGSRGDHASLAGRELGLHPYTPSSLEVFTHLKRLCPHLGRINNGY